MALGGGVFVRTKTTTKTEGPKSFIYRPFPSSSSSMFLNLLLVVFLFSTINFLISVILFLVSIFFFAFICLFVWLLSLLFVSFCCVFLCMFFLFLFSSSTSSVLSASASSFGYFVFNSTCFVFLCASSYSSSYPDQCPLASFLHLLGTTIMNNEGEEIEREREKRMKKKRSRVV